MAMERKIGVVYKHVQAAPAETWTIEHNLGVYPIVDAWTTDGGELKKILPAGVNYVNANSCTLEFSSAISGFATVV